MAVSRILSILDRLSVKTIFFNSTSSMCGSVCTIVFLIVAMVMFIPPVSQYLGGNYFQSQFYSSKAPTQMYYSGDDFLLAMSFRNKMTNQYANHTEIMEKLVTRGSYISYKNYYQRMLIPCEPKLFSDASQILNPIDLDTSQCIMLQSGLQYAAQIQIVYLPIIRLIFQTRCDDVFSCTKSSTFYNQKKDFIQKLGEDYYYELIFSSKIISSSGRTLKQLHKAYSSEYTSSQQDTSSTVLKIDMARKTTIIDDSIMPWWNNQSHHNLVWKGVADGIPQSQDQVSQDGFFSQLITDDTYVFAFRYYKKLDFILGMLGGGVFLLFLLFWIPVSYINRELNKMNTLEKLYVYGGNSVVSENQLEPYNVSVWHIITKFFSTGSKQQKKAIEQSEHEMLDIAQLIKKLKVADRNITNQSRYYPQYRFNPKDIDYRGQESESHVQNQALNNTNKKLDLTTPVYTALKTSEKTVQIYENNPTIMAIKSTQQSNQILSDLMQDQNQCKIDRPVLNSIENNVSGFCQFLGHYLRQGIRSFDIFGAKPTFNAEPQSSSCFGLWITLLIMFLSIGTFALTLSNINQIQIITSYEYKQPQHNSYQMVSGDDIRVAICFDSYAVNTILTGSNIVADIKFFQYENGKGYTELGTERMAANQFPSYFELQANEANSMVNSKYCFKVSDNQRIKMGGSFGTSNQAYFGFTLLPSCTGTVQYCKTKKNDTRDKYLEFVNTNTFGMYISENEYDPFKKKLVSSSYQESLSQSNYLLNASFYRTETIYVSSVQIIDDTSYTFMRQDPVSLQKTLSYQQFQDRTQQRKSDPSYQQPGYRLILRPNGQNKKIIQRRYKVDFVIGTIGGVFLFWYFWLSLFGKWYNSFKVRAKLASLLYRQDIYEEQSFFMHFLYLCGAREKCIKCLAGQKFGNRLERIHLIDKKINSQNLNHIYLIKEVDNCYRLSSSKFYTLQEKDLALIYLKQKIDFNQKVRQHPLNEFMQQAARIGFGQDGAVKNILYENASQLGNDDDFMDLEDFDLAQNGTMQQDNKKDNNNMIDRTHQKMLPRNQQKLSQPNLKNKKSSSLLQLSKSSQTQPLKDQQNPPQTHQYISKISHHVDLFQTPPQFTLNGQRDIKSIVGGTFFIIILIFIILICGYYVNLVATGKAYTVSYQRFIDQNLQKANLNSAQMMGQLTTGISLQTGKNFKFMVSFEKKDQYFPHDATAMVGNNGVGIRMIKYRIEKFNGLINETNEYVELTLCDKNYITGQKRWIGVYNDRQIYQHPNITFMYCLPDNQVFSLRGTPQQHIRQYFKLNIYNKPGTNAGRLILNSLFQVYIPRYYMSVPKIDMFADSFAYEMTSWSQNTDLVSSNIQTNLTFSKLLLTDKYQSRSRQSYNDRTSKVKKRQDQNSFSNEYQRNMSFYYDGVIDHYALDYPSSAEVFGMVGGVIAVFFFSVWFVVSSFNNYRMKYLIGQRLYSFDGRLSSVLEETAKKQRIRKSKGWNINNENENDLGDGNGKNNLSQMFPNQSREQLKQQLKHLNNLTQADLFKAWLLTPIGYIRNDYNFSDTLRHVTLIVHRVQADINLFQYCYRLQAIKDTLNRNIKLERNQQGGRSRGQDRDQGPTSIRQQSQFQLPSQLPIKVTSIYPKHIYINNPQRNNTLQQETKKYDLSSFERRKIIRALQMQQKVNPQIIFNGNKALNKIFEAEGLDESVSSAWQNTANVDAEIESKALNQPPEKTPLKKNKSYQDPRLSGSNTHFMVSEDGFMDDKQGNKDQLRQSQIEVHIQEEFTIEQQQSSR